MKDLIDLGGLAVEVVDSDTVAFIPGTRMAVHYPLILLSVV